VFVGELFAEHSRMVLGLCRLLLRNPNEAEDATQQVFLSAHRAVLGGSVPREAPAWLAAIARNECRARIRARMREPLSVPELPSNLPDPVASAIRTVDLDGLRDALSTLPRRQRRACLLRELGGLSYGELGRALGTSPSAVESLLFRARQQLRMLLRSANAAAVPLALRDELARLIPGFDPGTVGLAARLAAIPVTVKLATAAAGIGAVTAGAFELPQHHPQPAAETRAPAASPAATPPEPTERPNPVPTAQRSSRTSGAERPAPARRKAEHAGRQRELASADSEHAQSGNQNESDHKRAGSELEHAAFQPQSHDDSHDGPPPQDQPEPPPGSGD
jgi:RNA polymerase sigma-70 factor (ECF subfamily)